MFMRQVLGLYMLANGTPRRVIETFSHLGITASYSTLNRLLNDMEKHAKRNLKRAAHDPNGVIVYDNFNFKNRIRELAGGRQDQFINLTTACLVDCPELNGPLKQSSLDLTQRFTKDMVIQYLLPRPRRVDSKSKWLMAYAFKTLFKKKGTPPPYSPVAQVQYKDSPFLQIGAIFEDEGTIEGVYRLHEELWQRRLEFKDYNDRLTLVYGDMKTTSFIRRIQRSQLEATDSWEQRKWMLPIPAFFHIELNYIEMLFRIFWDTGSKSMSSATISADVHFFQRGRHIHKKDVKYHQVMPLLMHGYTARIVAFVIQRMVDAEKLNANELTIDVVKQAMEDLDTTELIDILAPIWDDVFSFEGWTGRYGDSGDHVDVEFRNHCRLMQCVEVLLIIHEAVRRGDYGLLNLIIPILPVLFSGGKSSNYGPEMMYFAWLLHPNVSIDEATRHAILKGGLVRCTTAGSMYKAIDLMLEHINATYALDIKNHKNSTHDIHATFSRLALNGNYLATIRKSVEIVFGRHQKGTHIAGDATTDILSYACKLYKDGMSKRSTQPTQAADDAYNAPDIYEQGQKILLKKLAEFNDVVPYPNDAADQRFLPLTGEGGLEDGELGYEDEGERLFDVDDNETFWNVGMDDLGAAM